MKFSQKIIRIVGVLYIIQMATAVTSYSVILEPILYQNNYLDLLVAKDTQVILAMLLDLVCGASVFAIAILLFPILKHFNERIALWYAGMRLAELMCLVISGILLLTLLTIGQKLNGSTDPSTLQDIAYFLRNARGNTQDASLLIYCLGAWSFYGLLYYTKLIPGFISIWGLIAVTLLCIEIVCNIFDSSVGGMLIMMPLGLNEVFLGIWLMVKGFDRSRIVDINIPSEE